MNWKKQRILKKIQGNYCYSSVVSQKGSQYYIARQYAVELVGELALTAIIWASMATVILWTV